MASAPVTVLSNAASADSGAEASNLATGRRGRMRHIGSTLFQTEVVEGEAASSSNRASAKEMPL
jgi:hypothetical protein